MWLSAVCFCFASRRRHTRWTGDWSSDVCSSDLADEAADLVRANLEEPDGPAAIDGDVAETTLTGGHVERCLLSIGTDAQELVRVRERGPHRPVVSDGNAKGSGIQGGRRGERSDDMTPEAPVLQVCDAHKTRLSEPHGAIRRDGKPPQSGHRRLETEGGDRPVGRRPTDLLLWRFRVPRPAGAVDG